MRKGYPRGRTSIPEKKVEQVSNLEAGGGWGVRLGLDVQYWKVYALKSYKLRLSPKEKRKRTSQSECRKPKWDKIGCWQRFATQGFRGTMAHIKKWKYQ